jgi:putative ABC transport system permease protein
MFKNYLKIAFRNLYRNKGFSIINISGLSIGLAVSLVISFYVMDDLTYDKFHNDSDSIYRMLTIENSGDDSAITYSITSGPLIVGLKDAIPEVVASTRTFGFGQVPVVRAVEGVTPDFQNGIQANGIITDPEFFKIFTFPILQGEGPEALLVEGNTFITPELAEAIFGDEDPINQILSVPRQAIPLRIVGLITAPPENSHIKFNLISALITSQNPLWWDTWENLMLSGYLKVRENTDIAELERKITEYGQSNRFAEINVPKLQPLSDVHLGSSEFRYDGFNRGKTDRSVVYALTIIGILVILIAGINFINLSTARAAQRAREVGLRKVVGSNRRKLIIQFLGESTVITMIAMLISLLILEISQEYIIDFLGKPLNISISQNPVLLVYLITVSIFIGLASGIYPALILSNFNPITVLRGKFKTSKTGIALRRILVVLQFTATISLIAGVMIVNHQIEYLKKLDLGYNRDHVVVIPSPIQNGNDIFTSELNNMPFVLSTARASNPPGGGFLRIEVVPEGVDREHSRMFQRLLVDEDFVETMQIAMVSGRDFSRQFATDSVDALIINQTAADMIGWENAVGKRLEVIEIDGSPVPKRVIGVMSDVHFSPTRQSMEPMMFQLDPAQSNLIFARISGGRINETISLIKERFDEVLPEQQFNSFFLNDAFDNQFNADHNFAKNMSVFSGIAIFIACLGLLGLVSFMVTQRRQEIAVRKVLGCSIKRIVIILAVDFLKWVAIANLVAWPICYYAMNQWLAGFEYKVPFTIAPFIFSGITVMAIAAITLSYQAINAAIRNPIKSLRYE